MTKRLGRLIAILAILASLFVATTNTTLAEGSCISPHSSIDKIAVMRYWSDVHPAAPDFDAVSGAIWTRDLDQCAGAGAGSAVLPANIQTSNWIFQLGYQETGPGTRCFVYAFKTTDGICVSGAPSVLLNTAYKFTITLANLPNGTMNVHYTIINKSASPDVTVVDFYKNAPSIDFGWLAWWGVERQELESSIGNNHDSSDIDMRLMTYSFDGDGGVWHTVTGLLGTRMCNNNNAAPGCDFVRTSPIQSDSTQHFHIESNVYANDQVNFDNTAN